MRKSGISLLLMLFAVTGWAQESKTEKKDSVLPIIVEGTLENVPDGTVIKVSERYGKQIGFFSRENEGIDTVRNGKFRKVYYPLTDVNPRKNVDEYMITARYNGANLTGYLNFYVSPGAKATVTGVGTNLMNWYAKSDNPKQIEANEYHAYFDEKLPGYWNLIRKYQLSDEVDDDYYSLKKKVKESDSLYVEYMVDFMKDRKYSSVFAKALRNLSMYFSEGRNQGIKGKAVKLWAIVPKDEEMNDEFILLAKKNLLPKYEAIKIGEKLHDFVLYDHKDNEHHLTEFNGNGKYLLLEFNTRTFAPNVERRQNETLNALYKYHSDKVDMLLVNCDSKYDWDIECEDPNKYGRDPWYEWNDKNNAEEIKQRYGTETGPSYFFVDKDGTILGRISDTENLQEAIDKYFKL